MIKGLEALQEMRKYGAVMTKNCETIEKELTVLDIINRCPVEVINEAFTYSTYEELKKDWEKAAWIKSQAELDLLREVFDIL